MTDLLEYNLVRGDFMPPREVQSLESLAELEGRLLNRIGEGGGEVRGILRSTGVGVSDMLSSMFKRAKGSVLGRVVNGRYVARRFVCSLCRKEKGSGLGSAPVRVCRTLGNGVEKRRIVLLKVRGDGVMFLRGRVGRLRGRVSVLLRGRESDLRLLRAVPNVDGVSTSDVVTRVKADVSMFGARGRVDS